MTARPKTTTTTTTTMTKTTTMPMLSLAVALGCGGCAAASEGVWTASLSIVDDSGTPPSALADGYDVTATVDRLPSGGAGECSLAVRIDGLGEGSVPGGAGCDDDGFDGNIAGDGLDVDVADIDAVRVSGELAAEPASTTMTMRISGKSPAWERVYQGEATHAPEQ